MQIIIQLMKNIYKTDKCALYLTDNMMLSCTQHVNHVTYLVSINKLYDTPVTYLAQFNDGTSYINGSQLCRRHEPAGLTVYPRPPP